MKTLHSLLGIVVLGVPVVLSGCTSDDSTLFPSTASSTTSSSGGGQGGTDSGGAGQGGTGQGGAGQGGMGQGGGQCAPTTDGCTDCLYMMCMNVYCDCFGTTECPGIITCTQNCPPNDAQCLTTCYMMNSAGLAEFVLVSDCAGTQCQASCPGSMPADACSLCLSSQCENQLETCYANSECMVLIGCIQACPPANMICQQQCAMQHPLGVPDVQALDMCAGASCSGLCN